MIIERPELEMYLPHEASMLLLDRIVGFDIGKGTLAAEVDTGAQDLFYHEELKGIPAWTGFEYMAQSIAALSGLNARKNLDAAPRIGFIMSIRAFTTSVPAYPAGHILRIEILQLFRDNSVVSFECRILDGTKVVTTAIVNAIEIESESMLQEVLCG